MAKDYFADFMSGTLGREELSSLQEHFAVCERCRGEAEELKSTWDFLDAPPPDQPSRDAPSRFEGMLQGYGERLNEDRTSQATALLPLWRQRWTLYKTVVAVATGVLLVIGAVAGYWVGSRGGADNDEVVQIRRELFEMRSLLALSLLQQQSVTQRLQGVGFIDQLEKPGMEIADALVDAVLHDSSVNVRVAAIDALGRFGEEYAVRKTVVQALQVEQSPFVQLGLIDLMVRWHDQDSIPILRRLSQDQTTQHFVVQRRAIEALEALR